MPDNSLQTELQDFDYDFTFVLPSFSFGPPGGYRVVFELAAMLKKNGYSVSLVFIKDIYKGLYKITEDINVKKAQKALSFKFRSYESFKNKFTIKMIWNVIKISEQMRIIDKLINKIKFPVDRDFVRDSNIFDIDLIFSFAVPEKLKTRRIIATAWETAYFVNDFNNCKRKYYLTQHDEDDPSFSGALSYLATKSYSFKLKKIVINKKMLTRFSDENPIKITVAAHVSGMLEIKPEDRGTSVLLQLRNSNDKGARYAIEAVHLIKEKNKEIKFISYGNYSGDIPSYIDHRGYVSNREYIHLFNTCSVFVLPSLVEGFSTPVLEAMSCACVPVATKCGGPEEMVEDNVNGILVPIKDPKSIHDSVLTLLKDKDKRIRMAYSALKSSKNYGPERMYDEFIQGLTSYEKRFIK